MPRLATLLLAALLGAPALCAQESALHVMSLNIRYGTADDGEDRWANRSHLVVDVIRRHAPDVLGLQEALRFQLDELGEALPAYAEVGMGRDDGVAAGEYAAVLFRTDRFVLAASGTFWLSDAPDVPGSMSWGNRITRICTWVRLVDRRLGRPFWVFNAHLDHESEASRARSVELIADRLAALSRDEPVIVLGDFNAAEETPPMRYLRGESDRASDVPAPPPSPRLRDTFRTLHPAETAVGTFHGFRGGTAGGRIDAILVSREWTVQRAAIVRWERGGRYPSDHYPVTAEIALP